MEGPVRFDVYGMPIAEHLEEARSVVAQVRPERTRADILKLFHQSRRHSKLLCVGTSLGWAEARSLELKLARCFSKLAIYQEGYGPDCAECSCCETHQLRYTGCLGCHVCNQRFEE